jgi:hypothetical protein
MRQYYAIPIGNLWCGVYKPLLNHSVKGSAKDKGYRLGA